MRKLKVEDLAVASFETEEARDGVRGTVRGLNAIVPGRTLTYEGSPTCYPEAGCSDGCTHQEW